MTTFLQNPNLLSFFGELIIQIFKKQDIDDRIFQLLYFSDRAAQIRQKEKYGESWGNCFLGEKRCLAYVLIQLGSIWNEGNEGNQKWEQRSRNPRNSAQLTYAVYFLPSGVSPRRASFRRLQRWYALRLPYASILASALLCFVLFLFSFSLSSLQICVCLVSIKSAFLFLLGFR